MPWIPALPLAELDQTGRAVARVEGRQILVLRTERGIHACTNRCPHEGYPLSEGTLADGCVLTCNWHNWKFDLESGATLVGGDVLRRFPVKIEAGSVWLDLAEPDPAERRAAILAGLTKTLEDRDIQRLARETARLARLGADPVDAVRAAVVWGHDRFEYGMTHAFAGATAWLELYDRPATGPDERLVALTEITAHIADDCAGSRRFPFSSARRPWDGNAFLGAVEREDEAGAVAIILGAIDDGVEIGRLLPDLAAAALAHYQDFGHSLIYAVKAVDLVGRLGAGTAEPILLSLVRSLVYAQREDLLPEFRDYRRRLEGWGVADGEIVPLGAAMLRDRSAKAAMAIVAGWSAQHTPQAIFETLLEAGAWNLLHVDTAFLVRTDLKLADNVTWLDFTHALTFASALRIVAAAAPALWPAGLLQLACFVGRNSGYVDAALDTGVWTVEDPDRFLARETAALFDHDRDRFIVSVHLVKTLLAGAVEARACPVAAPLIHAALNRFLRAPLRLRHPLRMARQMRAFVEQE